MGDTKRRIRAFVMETFYVPEDTPLDDEASLIGSGIVDSTGVLEIVDFLEEAFGVRVSDAQMLPDNLDSIGRIARFVERMQGPTASERQAAVEVDSVAV